MKTTIYSLLTIVNEDYEDTDVTLCKDFKQFFDEILCRSNFYSYYEYDDFEIFLLVKSLDKDDESDQENETLQYRLSNTPEAVEDFLNTFTDQVLLQADKYKIETHTI